MKAAPHTCPICGSVYFNSRHDRKRYCGAFCRTLARIGSVCDVRYTEFKGRRRRVWFVDCRDCGQLFTARSGTALRCIPCRTLRKWQMNDRQEKVSKLLPYIGHRDHWRCGICSRPVASRTYSHDDVMSPTMDHIIPTAEGGTDDPTNLRLAHMICNSYRQHYGGGEQLALVG